MVQVSKRKDLQGASVVPDSERILNNKGRICR